MFDNGLNIEEKETEKQPVKKSSLITTFTDEELANLQNSSKKEEKVEKVEKFEDNGFASVSPYLSLRSNIERMLAGRDYEEKIVALVDSILLDEQNALNDETKKKIQLEKYIFGLAFTSCNCYGDQQNFLYLMADRLGVRR